MRIFGWLFLVGGEDMRIFGWQLYVGGEDFWIVVLGWR